MTYRLAEIDELTRKDHYHLSEEDKCYYYGEYTARKGYGHSDTNQLISNLKKKISRKGKNDYQYKEAAIKKVAKIISATISNLGDFTFVPIPPSKCKSDAAYDNRMALILKECKTIRPELDFRELITQKESTEAAHETQGSRPTPETIACNYCFNMALTQNIRNSIVIFDDVLTAGSHFKAMKMVINKYLPEANVIGLFIARTARGSDLYPINFKMQT